MSRGMTDRVAIATDKPDYGSLDRRIVRDALCFEFEVKIDFKTLTPANANARQLRPIRFARSPFKFPGSACGSAKKCAVQSEREKDVSQSRAVRLVEFYTRGDSRWFSEPPLLLVNMHRSHR